MNTAERNAFSKLNKAIMYQNITIKKLEEFIITLLRDVSTNDLPKHILHFNKIRNRKKTACKMFNINEMK